MGLFHKAVSWTRIFSPQYVTFGISYVLEIDFGFSKDIQETLKIHEMYARQRLILTPQSIAVYN